MAFDPSIVPNGNKLKLTLDSSQITGDQTDFPLTIPLGSDSLHDAIFDELAPVGNDEYTKLLIESNTVDGSTTFIDSSTSAHTITPYADAHHETDQAKFYDTSIALDGTGDYLSIPDSPDFYFDGDFTLDCWVRPATVNTSYCLACQYGDNTNRFLWNLDASGVMSFWIMGVSYNSSAHGIVANTWNHVAVVRSGNTLYHFVNGVLKGTNAFSITYPDMGTFYIGARRYDSSFALFLNGYLDEFRASKGIARWTENFTPPVRAYTESLNKKLSIDVSGTQCPVEIEHWDSVGEKAALHTKIPTYTGTVDSELTLSWDKSQPDNTGYVGDIGDTVAQTVWDANFVFVSHQAQDPSGTAPQILDSTSYAKHGTSYGSMTSDDLIDGLVGKALDYDGTGDYTNHGYDSAHNITTTLTLEATIKPGITLDSGLSDYVYIIDRQSDPSSTGDSYGLYINADGELHLGSYGGSIQSTKASWTIDTIYCVAGTYNSTGLIGDLFVDGIKEVLSSDAYDSMAGVTNNLIIGGPTTNRFFPGGLDEIRISNIVRSDDWLKLTNLSLRDQLITWSEISAIIKQYLDQIYDLTPEILKQFLDQEYDLMNILKHYLDQKYGQTIAIYLAMYYGAAPAIRTFLEQRYQDLPLVKAILDMPYEDLLTLRAYLDQPYHLPQALIAIMEQKYGINEAVLIAMLDQNYDISIRNHIVSLLNQVYGLQGDRSVDHITNSLTMNDKVVPIRAASGECSIDNFCITIDVTLADYADYLSTNIDDTAIFVNGPDVYHMVVDSKQRSRASVANTNYQLFLKSPRIDLQSPRCKTFTHEYAAGNAETIIEDVLGEEIDWQTVGFPILTDKLYANDETKIDIVRKVIRTVGAKLQSNRDGSLRAIPEYPTPVNQWTEPDYFMTDTVDFVSQNESFKHNTGFNRFTVKNENTPEDRIWTEQEEITAYKKKVLVFQTPWDSETQFDLIHSGGSPVPAPEYQGIVEVEQPAEQIEFVAGFANTSRPIYGNLQIKWLRENLGNITFSEDGQLEAELKTGATEGYSLAEIIYTTKYHLWHVSDLLDEDVQYILKEIINE